MIITYSGKSRPSAIAIAQESDDIRLNRGPTGFVNWGRATANTKLNPDISKTTNKRVMRQLFAEKAVPMPKLVVERQVRESLYAKEGKVFIGRPDTHTKGRGFWKIIRPRDLEAALRGTRKKRAATHFMEYVESDREYRVHIFNGKSIRISEKRFDDDTKKNYTTAKPGDVPLSKVRNAAKAAVSAVGLDFGAVDILARGDRNDEVFVLEVNSAPGLGGTMPKLYADTFLKYMEEV